MSDTRRGFRKISTLPPAGDLTGALAEIEGVDGLAYQTPAGGGSSDGGEERPGVPSPYDDEFDGTTLDAKWTQLVGTSATHSIRYSCMLHLGTNRLAQPHTLTHPLRIRMGACGLSEYAGFGTRIFLMGALKGIRFGIDQDTSGYNRHILVEKIDPSYVAAAILSEKLPSAGLSAGGVGSIALLESDITLTLMVDSTNVTCWIGGFGGPRLAYTYARSYLGTLAYFGTQCDKGVRLKWFRVDRATTAYAFPLDWAG